VKKMKNAISRLVPEFNTARMVREYTERFYVPAVRETHRMIDGDLAGARALAAWKQKVRTGWHEVQIREVVPRSQGELKVGDPMRVEALVHLGSLAPEDVAVELYHGPTAGAHELSRGEIVRMKLVGGPVEGIYKYLGEIPTRSSGAHAFAARVMPWNPNMSHPYETSLIRWA
jgi:starch phosphorylase